MPAMEMKLGYLKSRKRLNRPIVCIGCATYCSVYYVGTVCSPAACTHLPNRLHKKLFASTPAGLLNTHKNQSSRVLAACVKGSLTSFMSFCC